jgi:hypothetical protein
VIATKAALDDAVQAQPAAVVTPTDALAPVPAMLSDVVDTAYVQVVGCGLGVVGVVVSEQDAPNMTATSAIGKPRLMDRA